MPALGRFIALVEDDLGMREALARVVNAAGFRVCSFSSAEALPGEPRRGREPGRRGLSPKPFTGRELLEAIDAALPEAVAT